MLKESSKEIVEEVAVTKSIAAGGKVVQNQLDTAKAYGEYTALIDKVIEEGNDGMAQAADVGPQLLCFWNRSRELKNRSLLRRSSLTLTSKKH